MVKQDSMDGKAGLYGCESRTLWMVKQDSMDGKARLYGW